MARLIFLTGILITGCLTTGTAQTGTSAFGVLDTVNYQPQDCFSSYENGVYLYRVDGEIVDSLRHSECLENYQKMTDCRPCWSKAYDKEGRLLNEAAAYGDCLIGGYRTYYPSGKIKIAGQYSSTTVVDTAGNVRPASCSIQSGDWVYYLENGTIDYEEVWNDGSFIQQIPNKGESEVWAIDLTFFGGKFDSRIDILRLDMVNKLTISPKYKNANRTAEIKGVVEVSHVGHPKKTIEFTPTSYPYINWDSLLPEGNDWKAEDLWIDLKFQVDRDDFVWYRIKAY